MSETIGLDTKLLFADLQHRGIEVHLVAGGLLKLVGFVELKAVERFAVAENFKEGNVVGGREIVWVGANFKERYYGHVEEYVPERTILIWEFTKSSLDAPVIHILGGADEPKTETCLAHTFQMMELGEKACARMDGYANLSYKRSPKDGCLWVPGWRVRGGKLDVEARSSSDRYGWRDGFRVSGG